MSTKTTETKRPAKVSIEIHPHSIVDETLGFVRGVSRLVDEAEADRLVALTYNGSPVFRLTPSDQE